MQVVSAAQTLAELARDRAESIFARVNRMVLVSEMLSGLLVRNEIPHIGTRHNPGQE